MTEDSQPPIDFLEVLALRLKKPLAAAKAAAEELRMTATDPNSQRSGEIILGQVGQMDRMIQSLLELSLLERGRLQLAHSRVEMQTVIEAAVEDCRPSLEAKSQRLVLDMPDPDLQIDGDERQLVHIVRSLLDNAVKFTSPGGSIELSIVPVVSYAQIEVRDTGCGITPEFLPKLFDPFVLDASTAQDDNGLGVSLTITKHLVELHRGTITAYSAGPGQGAEFRVCLPL
jgi:signal transduction histidine kinase